MKILAIMIARNVNACVFNNNKIIKELIVYYQLYVDILKYYDSKYEKHAYM